MAKQSRSPARSVAIHTWVAPAVRAELAAVAERNERSVAAEMRVALHEHVRHEQPAGEKEGG